MIEFEPGLVSGGKALLADKGTAPLRSAPASLSLGVRVKLKINSIMVHSLNRRPLRIDPSRGLVSFTFDDFPASAYRAGGAILERYGVRGTYYASLGLLGGENEGQPMMGGDDVVELMRHGHELGCHTYSHTSCRGLARCLLEADLGRSAGALARLESGAKFRSFAYPFGDISLAAKQIVGRHFTTCRGRRAGLNHGTVDLAALNSESLYMRSAPIERTLAAIARNAKERGWLIFCAHDIANDPSPYGCTPEYLETAVKAAVESGSEVLTVADAYGRLSQVTY